MTEQRNPNTTTAEMLSEDQRASQANADTRGERAAGVSSTADLAAAMDTRASTSAGLSTNGGDGASASAARKKETTTERETAEPLFASDESEGFHSRWSEVQTGFVDEPRRAVEDADGLVAEVIQRLAKIFADERTNLEQQWDRGDDISTEDLRQALRRYRSFFERLLAA